MRIVDVSEFYAPDGGGVRTYVDQKLRAAAEHGHSLLVIAPGARDGIERRFGSRIAWVASPPLPVDPRYRVLLREKAVHALIAQERPHVVEGSSPFGGGAMVARYRAADNGASRPRKCFVFHQDAVAVYGHTSFDRWLSAGHIDRLCAPYWRYLRALSARFDATVVSADWLARRLAAHGVARPVRVPFGVDKPLFGSAAPDPALRAELLRKAGAPADAALLMCVSRHHPEKRLGTVFEALRLLAAKRPVALVVYGDGPLFRHHARRVRGSPIHLAGVTRDRRDLARALASADALVHGSAAETFGLVIAEALCAGLPLVVPDAGGAAELADEACAERYVAGDARGCAQAVERLMSRDALSLRAAASRAASARVLSQAEHFTKLWETYAALGSCAPFRAQDARATAPA